LHAVLKPAAISEREFFEWNPALQPTAKVIPVGYRVKLPAHKVDVFVSAQKRSATAPATKRAAASKVGVERARGTKAAVKSRTSSSSGSKAATDMPAPIKNRAAASNS
jgi:hypothetical protein